MTVSQAIFKERVKGFRVKSSLAHNEMIWELFPIFHTQQGEHFIAAAGAITGQYLLAATGFFSATVGNFFLVMVVLVFHLVKTAATGMIGPPFGRTPTGITIVNAFPSTSNGMG